jgi:hypothetical protein
MFEGYRDRSRLDRLIKDWTEYRRLALTRLGAGDVSAAEERRFLKLKGKIAESLASLSLDLGQNAAQEAQTHLRAIGDLLSRFPTLLADQPLDPQLKDGFERNWHDHYLFFNKLKGMRGRSETQEARAAKGPAPDGVGSIHKRSGGARSGVVLLRFAIVVAVIWILVRFVPWHRLGSISAEEGGLQAFASDAWGSVKEAVGSFSASSIGGVLKPAAEKYGPEATTVMVAVLLIALGYWIFIRMK